LTPDENTILHVCLRNQSSEPGFTDFVDKFLERCPPLLFQANKRGQTPLHLAARYGHSNVVEHLIDRTKALPSDLESRVTKAKMMSRMINGERDTALHEAARHRRSHVVEILTKEDPEFPYPTNVLCMDTKCLLAAMFVGSHVKHGCMVRVESGCRNIKYGGKSGCYN
jgi:ankyrin repeat protein